MAELNVLSWNICFGCMYANEKSKSDVTALVIAEYCKTKNKETNTHECLNNVIKFINNGNYDLIGLQEVVETINWDEIISRNTNLQKMAYVFNTVNFKFNGKDPDLAASMVTLYNKERFTLIAATVGNLSTDKFDGRPYQMLYLNDNTTNDKYLMINLHNGKFDPFHKEELEKKFSTFINQPVGYLNQNNIHSLKLDDKKTSLREIICETIPHVICLGDFNDGPYQHKKYINDFKLRKEPTYSDLNTRKEFMRYRKAQLGKDYLEKYWQGLQLFKNSESILNKIIINTKGIEPPKTCCTGKEFLRGFLNPKTGKLEPANVFSNDDYTPFDKAQIDKNDDGDKDFGDYILISNGLDYDHTFITAHNVGASSDHKPVSCKITVSRESSDFKKYLIYKNKYLKLKNISNTII